MRNARYVRYAGGSRLLDPGTRYACRYAGCPVLRPIKFMFSSFSHAMGRRAGDGSRPSTRNSLFAIGPTWVAPARPDSSFPTPRSLLPVPPTSLFPLVATLPHSLFDIRHSLSAFPLPHSPLPISSFEFLVSTADHP